MINYEKQDHEQKAESERTLVAVFQSRGEARSAIAALHKAKYTHTWLGTTSIAEKAGGDEALTVETGGFFADSQSLVDALVSHGVTSDAARMFEGRIEAGNAILTVNPKDRHVTEPADIIREHGGRIASGMSNHDWDTWPSSTTSADSYQLGDDEFEELHFVRR